MTLTELIDHLQGLSHSMMHDPIVVFASDMDFEVEEKDVFLSKSKRYTRGDEEVLVIVDKY